MSRKGNKLLNIPTGVNVAIKQNLVEIFNAKGKMQIDFPNFIKVEQINNQIKVSRSNDEKKSKAFHGTINSLINNALIGLSTGFKIELHIEGVGYKANVSGKKLNLAIGFSHPVVFDIPDGLDVQCANPTSITISGFDKIKVGEFASNIRSIRKPEPYNGKGIMYVGEHIIRKVGKTAETAKK